MHRPNAFLLALACHALTTSASPLSTRQETTDDMGLSDCVDTQVDNVTSGKLYCVASDGSDMGCESCLGLNGDPL